MGIHFKKSALLLLALWVSGVGLLSAQTSSSLAPFNEAPLRTERAECYSAIRWLVFQRRWHFYPVFRLFQYEHGTVAGCSTWKWVTSLNPRSMTACSLRISIRCLRQFLTRQFRHHWCVFSVIVPEDFGDSEVLWTLETQGNSLEVPGWLIPSYVLDEETTSGRDAIAPYLSLNDDPPNFRGRKGLWEGPRIAKVGEPVPFDRTYFASRSRHLVGLDAASGAWTGRVQ